MAEWLSWAVPAVGNHLWQSTAFAAVASVVTLLLRRNQARVRYAVWLAASVKFLVPFSLLIGLGSLLPRPHHAVVAMPVYSAVGSVVAPFGENAAIDVAGAPRLSIVQRLVTSSLPLLLAVVWLCGVAIVLVVWFVRWRKVARILQRGLRADGGRELEVLRRVQGAMGGRAVSLLLSRELMEPGIFGILHPVLIWPERLSDRLDDEHIEAIMAHEMVHARRRDNLTAVLHMVVEAAFWVHPMVWWIERRMVEEREYACDEAVVALGSRPGTYAESLLKAVRFCVESPLTCVSGITGADLNTRIVSIMKQGLANKLSLGRKLLLGGCGIAVIAGPIAFGLLNLPAVWAQLLRPTSGPRPSFEVATIKPTPPEDTDREIGFSPGKFLVRHQSIGSVIKFAYNFTSDDQLLGGPDWINTAMFNIDAKEEATLAESLEKLPPNQSADQIRLMVQSLLADRLHLRVKVETRQLPVYALIVAKNGSKLTPTVDAGGGPHGVFMMGRGHLTGHGGEVGSLAGVLVRLAPELGGRVVIDRTGLKDHYDWDLKWTPENMASPINRSEGGSTPFPGGDVTPDVPGASIFSALQEQLGLKLVPSKGPVEVLVIEHVERPSEN